MRVPKDATHLHRTYVIFYKYDRGWFQYQRGRWVEKAAPSANNITKLKPPSVSDADILRTAKRVLIDRPADFGFGVCAALKVAGEVHDSANNSRVLLQRQSLKEWVDSMMGRIAWLRFWLIDRGVMVGDTQAHREKLKATRLAWLDWMIQQCELEESKTP
ncbi:hypothetical protein UFOVP814_46 [uncultured Caudovirales phage]|uniref:Uncharacterized protein n=1 Tax=uncultured Caudovirales phage TaxID=2100421 RepID=A0A6J5P2T1_9CAUD|nr:hypothetical protein UFOVP814_46 [uncultured Caudovirales phage]